MLKFFCSFLFEIFWTFLACTWFILRLFSGSFLVILLCLPTVAARSGQQPFPDITFKVFSDFITQNFSSRISLATVLLVLFSLTENPDLLNLHSRRKTPLLNGENQQSSSGWIKELANALAEHLEDRTKTLFKHRNQPQNLDIASMIDPLASKLDELAELLNLVPVYSQTSQKVKHKLATISHQEIAPVHVICPIFMECNEPHCSNWSLRQDTRTRDIPRVTLIKGTTIYKNVHVLSGLCTHCNTKYYADHKGINQIPTKKQILHLNSAKYMKIGQSKWVDRTFGNAVVNGMYSFHASAAAYTDYWNNTFGEVDLNHMAPLSRRHIWQTFIQESTRAVAADQNCSLTLNESLPIDAVTQAAFNNLGQGGIISASQGHACPECTQPFRSSNDPNDMDVEQGDVTMHVVDGIVMGPTHCAYGNCENELLNSRGGAFCAIHEQEHGNRCRIIDCNQDRIPLTQACQQHQHQWQNHIQNRAPGALAGVRRMLRRPEENMEWLPNPIQHDHHPHDGPALPDRAVKNYFSPNRYYCVETVCAPCGTVIAWTKFARSESPSHIIAFLNKIYPTLESRPAYICIDKACVVLKHLNATKTLEDWFKTTRFIVDSYHYTNHKATDVICSTWCNPAPTDGSAPNLVIPAIDKFGNDCLQRAFNTQVIFVSLYIVIFLTGAYSLVNN
jgi:hypothetical protein